MNRVPVQSSDITSIGYNQSTHTLEIEFKTGAVYQYTGVPEAEYTLLMAAESHGGYFSKYIKGKYGYRKL